MGDLKNLQKVAQKLVDQVEYDVCGKNGKGGNGGLVSTETIRAADECRLVLNTIAAVKGDEVAK
jgi:hypothetical protein